MKTHIRKTPGKGSKRGSRPKLRIVVGFDEVRGMAIEAGNSMGQQIRVLVERGIISSEDFK